MVKLTLAGLHLGEMLVYGVDVSNIAENVMQYGCNIQT